MMAIYHIDEEREEFVAGDINKCESLKLEERLFIPRPRDLIPMVGLVLRGVEGYRKGFDPDNLPYLDERFLFLQQCLATSVYYVARGLF